MLSARTLILSLLTLRLFSFTASTLAAPEPDDDRIALSQVPAPVLKIVQKALPALRLSHAYKELDEGKTIYEVCGKDEQNRDVEVEITGRGVILGVETTIAAKEVPKVVIEALRAKARSIHFDSAEVVTRNGQVIAYEFEGENAQGDEVEVTVSPDGRTVEIEEVDED